MGWETRRRGSSYYVRKERQRDRVVSHYIGGGAIGSLAALYDVREQDKRRRERKKERAERDRLAADDRTMEEFFAEVEETVRQVLEAAGYHQHNRGEWRKRRAKRADAGTSSTG